jgi:type IV secretion system protein VirB1
VDLSSLLLACAPLVDPGTARALVSVESTRNPYAIGVVNGALVRQPRSLAEAIATVRHLRALGRDFSAGLAQINVRNWKRLELDERSAFEPCRNLRAMQSVLGECYESAPARRADPQQGLRQALSCYYSGNFTTGFRHGYVQSVVRAGRTSPSIELDFNNHP